MSGPPGRQGGGGRSCLACWAEDGGPGRAEEGGAARSALPGRE